MFLDFTHFLYALRRLFSFTYIYVYLYIYIYIYIYIKSHTYKKDSGVARVMTNK